MSIKTESYTRMPFHVDAVQVTKQNINEVAAWCEGEVHSMAKTVHGVPGSEPTQITVPYVKVVIHRPLNERQTKAFYGDWILQSETGFKVYTERAFANSFTKETEKSEKQATPPAHAAIELTLVK